MMALVVATAGMMFPAICLISNFVFIGMWKIYDRRLAAETTKSKVSSSSLSKSTGPCLSLWEILHVESIKRARFSSTVHSSCPSRSSISDGSHFKGSGFSLVFHRVSIRKSLSMSSLKIFSTILDTKLLSPGTAWLTRTLRSSNSFDSFNSASISALLSLSMSCGFSFSWSETSSPKSCGNRKFFAQVMQ
ncbi:hypothetical protein OGATHE_003597 [Ogataea polymorpha]|uniref:Uncharacterized protein n=1 Tax=Ogataea polymorpha TaxID=460523 RepID=A0A9P8P4K1_9ASCO|nr:hypothetical protein OGATHE_003597 [Ogataea polymorpha]